MTGLELLRQIADLIDTKQLTSSELDTLIENMDVHLTNNKTALRLAFWLATKENRLCLCPRRQAVLWSSRSWSLRSALWYYRESDRKGESKWCPRVRHAVRPGSIISSKRRSGSRRCSGTSARTARQFPAFHSEYTNVRFAMATMPLRESLTMTASTYPGPYGSGNSITITGTLPSNTIITTGSAATSIGGGGGGGINWYPQGPIWGTANTFPLGTAGTAYTYPYPVITPNEVLLNDSAVMDSFIDRVVTETDTSKTLVICVDMDCSPEVQNEIAGRLADRGIQAMVIVGARAGYGYPSFNANPEDRRVDMLARIGELWEQRPDLKLTELFQWYAGADMEDEDFVKCTEVHFKKMSEM